MITALTVLGILILVLGYCIGVVVGYRSSARDILAYMERLERGEK